MDGWKKNLEIFVKNVKTHDFFEVKNLNFTALLYNIAKFTADCADPSSTFLVLIVIRNDRILLFSSRFE